MERGKRKQRTGVVISDRMQKTVVVRVERTYRHAKLDTVVRTHKKYRAHDEKNDCKTGDKVLIEETRPLSKTKSWRVAQVIERAK